MMRGLGISPGHRRQLLEQSAAQRRRIVNGTALQAIASVPAPAPREQPPSPPQPPAPPPAPSRKPPTKQERFRAKHAKKHVSLMRSLDKRSWDVRAAVVALEWFGQCVIRLMHFYADARSFVDAHTAGSCSRADCEMRREKCAPCPSAYAHKGHGHCKDCDCGAWPPSRRTHQTRLANFACPKRQFGRAPGWIPRFFQWARLKRRSTDRR